MARIPFSLDELARHSEPESFRRGKRYARDDAVFDLRVRGSRFEAAVRGSQYEPYRVRVTFDETGITEATCSCPYDWGGWCKHIIAALLVYDVAPEDVEVRPALEERLERLDDEERAELLLAIAQDPTLMVGLERHLDRLAFQQSREQRQPGQGLDLEAYRQSVRHAFRERHIGGYEHSYYDEEASFIDLSIPLGEIDDLLRKGEGRNALALLEILTGEVVHLAELDPELQYGLDLPDFDTLWTKALLLESLPDRERRAWEQRFLAWDEVLDEFGMGAQFEAAQLAADQGWETPLLQAWLQGKAEPEEDELEDLSLDAQATLAGAVLDILDGRGEEEPFLAVARASGNVLTYLRRLIAQGRGEQAAAEAATFVRSPGGALEIAQLLAAAALPDASLQVGERGLELDDSNPMQPEWGGFMHHAYGNRYRLATWVAELAIAQGQDGLALRASEIAFQEIPTVEGYDRMRKVVGAAWEEGYRPCLLEKLREMGGSRPEAAVEIFLREGLVEDAMRVATRSRSDRFVLRVIPRAVAAHPKWVIGEATTRAEAIMDAGQSGRYEEAIAWLRHARDAYRASGRADQWQSYLSTLREKHGRKYKLMGLMKGL